MAHIQYCMDFDFTHLKDRELGSFSSLPTIPSFCFVTFQIACSFISEKAASFSRSAELHSDPMSPSTSRCPCFLPTRSPQASSHRYQPIARDTSPSRDDQLRSPADDLPKRHSAADGVRVAETLRFQPDPGEALPVRRGAGSEGGQSVLVEQQAHGSKEGCTAVEPPADQGDDAEALREEEQFPAESRWEGGCAADGAARGEAEKERATVLLLLLLWGRGE